MFFLSDFETKSYKYVFSDSKLPWTDARRKCLKQNGDLLSIYNQEEQMAVNSFLPAKGLFWTGLNDKAMENIFLWSDGTRQSYTNWKSSSTNRHSSDCVAVDTNGKWNYLNCGHSHSYACKIPSK